MAAIEITSPNFWALPEESNLSRDLVDQAHQRGMLDYALTQKDKYDFKTLFYSVSYCRARGFFYAFGPPMLNLESEMLPMAARYSTDNGKSFTSIECVPIQRTVSIGLNIRLMHVGDLPQNNLLLELTLANGMSKIFTIGNSEKPRERLTINTLQKDNEIGWIVDWVNYYRTYGVFSFHIYDNGSSNFPEMMEAIRLNIADDTNIKITKWPFRYGIAKLGQSLFAQKASILDFVLQNQNTAWAINCDIDEYITIPDKYSSLFDFFSSFHDDVGCVQFSCFDAPLVQGVNYPPEISIRDIVWRMRDHKNKFKNGFRPSAVETPSIHFVNLKNQMKTENPSTKDVYYLHALPLNTGWEQKNRRRGLRRLDKKYFIKDERIANRLKL